MSQSRKATDRLLDVFDAIALHGPISLAELTKRTALPRSSVHRAVQVLQRKGWVNPRLSDHHYQVSHAFGEKIEQARVTQHSVELLQELIRDLVKMYKVHCELGIFTTIGQFQTIETTEKNAPLELAHSLVSSPIALMAQLVLPAAQLIRHLDAFSRQAREIERIEITSGRHRRALRGLAQLGHGAIPPFLAYPFRTPKGYFGCLLIRHQNYRTDDSDSLKHLSADIFQLLEASDVNFASLEA